MNQEWKNIATYYNEILNKWIREFFNNHPNVGQLLQEEYNQKTDYIRNVNLFDLFESTVNLFDEVVEKENLEFLKEALPRPFKHKDLAEELVNHVQNQEKEVFRKYKTEMFNDWQRRWIGTLANVKRQFIQIDVMDYGKKPLFLINAYISEFELFHNFILIPFTNDILLEETSYRNRLNVLSICINILEFDEKDKSGLLLELRDIFEPNQRNSLVKHNYMFEEDSNIIHLFSPDAFVRKYKPYGELEYKQFIRLVILMKAIFWTLVRGMTHQSAKVKTIVDEVIASYPYFFKVIEQNILNPELNALLNLFTDCFTGLSSKFELNLEKNYGEEVLRYQLLESFLIFRILIGIFLKPDIIPKRNILTNFNMFQKIIIDHAMMKMQYLVTYEEMMQTIVHPFTEMLFGETYKDYILKKIRKLENGKYSILFEELNKDFRDSLAHNGYYFNEKEGWVYTKYAKVLKRENIKLISSQLLFNYIDITNSIFPFLAEMPTDLATTQLIEDLFNKESTFSLKEWIEKEKFALNHVNSVFAGMTRIKLAMNHAEKFEYNEVSNSIRELFENNNSYKNLTVLDLEIILTFSSRFLGNIKSRLVVKTFARRLLKNEKISREVNERCLFVLLFVATLQKDHKEVNKLVKRIKEFKEEVNE